MHYAVVTGASRGIGKELALRLAERGIASVLVARNQAELLQLAEEIETKFGLHCKYVCCDLRFAEARIQVYQFCEEHGLTVSYLVNNAGFGTYGRFVDADAKTDLDLVEVNVAALTHLCHLFLPQMVKNGMGRILNVASVAAFMPGPHAAVYFASKAYVLHLSEALHTELKGTGVAVTTLCPGPTESKFMEVSGMEQSRMVKGRRLDDAAKVAEKGINAMLKGERVYIYGIFNRLLVYSSRLLPKRISLAVTEMLQRPATK